MLLSIVIVVVISGMQLLRLRSTIRRHHPSQRVVLSQICCFSDSGVANGGTLVVVRLKFFKSSRFGSVTTGYDTLLKFLLWLSVSNCVSFPCVVYFCLFSPLKDHYAFSTCLQLLGATSTGALPLDPAGDFRTSPKRLFPP